MTLLHQLFGWYLILTPIVSAFVFYFIMLSKEERKDIDGNELLFSSLNMVFILPVLLLCLVAMIFEWLRGKPIR